MTDIIEQYRTEARETAIEAVNPHELLFDLGSANLVKQNLQQDVLPSFYSTFNLATKDSLFAPTRGLAVWAAKQFFTDPNYNVFKDPTLIDEGDEFILRYQDALSGSVNANMTRNMVGRIKEQEQELALLAKRPFSSTAIQLLASTINASIFFAPSIASVSSLGTKALVNSAMGAAYGAGFTALQQQIDPTTTFGKI